MRGWMRRSPEGIAEATEAERKIPVAMLQGSLFEITRWTPLAHRVTFRARDDRRLTERSRRFVTRDVDTQTEIYVSIAFRGHGCEPSQVALLSKLCFADSRPAVSHSFDPRYAQGYRRVLSLDAKTGYEMRMVMNPTTFDRWHRM